MLKKPKTDGIFCSNGGGYTEAGLVPLAEIQKALKPCDIVFVSSVSAVGLLIRDNSRNVMPTGSWIPTHVEMVVMYDEEYESVTRSSEPIGYVGRKLSRLFVEGNRIEIWRPKDLTQAQIHAILRASWKRSIRQQGYGWREFASFKLPFIKASDKDDTFICSEAITLDYREGQADLMPGKNAAKVKPVNLYRRVTTINETPSFKLVAII